VELFQPRAYIPLGIAYIGAVLEDYNIDVEITQLADKEIEDITINDIPRAEWYGITCVASTLPSVIKLCDILDGNIVIGGPYPTVHPYYTLFDCNPNYVMRGEAEHSFLGLVMTGYNINRVIDAGIIQDLDTLPFPARHLFDENDVVDITGIHGCDKGIKATSMISSRGCPYQCAFCCKGHMMFNNYRFRSPDNIAKEIQSLIDDYDIEHIRFVDDIFTFDRDRVISLCDKIKDMGITWVNITRADRIDEEMLKHMKEAGCIETHIGIESGSQRLLSLMRKNETTHTYYKAGKMIKDAGIRLKVYLMYGFPTETEDDRCQTRELMKLMKPDKFTLSKFVPLPGSYLWEHPEEFGIKKPKSGWYYPDRKDKGWMKYKKELGDIIYG
jgi:radical SAM superfamily enzyme YgiQ (UPF0313 family)